jgi:hypothetical protein
MLSEEKQAAMKREQEAEATREARIREQLEANARAARAEEERRRQEEAEANKPTNVLLLAYARYIYLKRCREDREGYLAINISEAEMGKAKEAVQLIEAKLKTKLDPNVNVDAMWARANELANKRTGREKCQYTYRELLKMYQALAPESNTITKDF